MKFGTAILLVAAAGSVASADRIAATADSFTIPAELASINAGAPRGLAFVEDFETFTPGPLVPQGGWSSDFEANALATNVNPIAGGVSGRHTSDGSVFAGFEVRSPLFTAGFGAINADVQINGGTSLYQLVPVSNGTGFFSTRVNFDLNGDISVGQVNAAQTAFEFIDSGANWTPGQVMNIGVGVAGDGTLTVTMNGGTIFTGSDTASALGLGAGAVDQWLIFAGNEGVGNADGSGDTITFDNINIPAPGAIALAGLGGLAAARRRRA